MEVGLLVGRPRRRNAQGVSEWGGRVMYVGAQVGQESARVFRLCSNKGDKAHSPWRTQGSTLDPGSTQNQASRTQRTKDLLPSLGSACRG